MAVPSDHFRHFTLLSKWLSPPSSNASTKYSLRMSNTRRGASDWSWQFHQTGHPNSQQLAGKFRGEPYPTHHVGMEMLHSWLKKWIKRGNCALKKHPLLDITGVRHDWCILAVTLCPFSCLENFRVSRKSMKKLHSNMCMKQRGA